MDTSETPTGKTEQEPEDNDSGVVVVAIDQPSDSDEPAEAVVSDALAAGDWPVIERESVTAGYDAIQGAIDRLVARRDVEAVVTVGGTGVEETDVTVEALEPLFEKHLPGFGELFRVSYHERAGPAVVGMRPTAGISDGVPVFCLPGETESARFATEQIIVETLADLAAYSSGKPR